MDNSTKFLNTFNEFDLYMRKKLGIENSEEVNHGTLISKMKDKNKTLFENHKAELHMYTELRNAIVHMSQGEYRPIAEPHENIVKQFEKFVDYLKHPKTVLDISVRDQNIFKASPGDKALGVMKAMIENTYTHVPIVENGNLVGVFSENVLLRYLANEIEVAEDLREWTIGNLSKYYPINIDRSEHFEFVPRTMLALDVEQIFNERVRTGVRLGAVFVTESGKSTEKILGMITAWDLPKIAEQ